MRRQKQDEGQEQGGGGGERCAFRNLVEVKAMNITCWTLGWPDGLSLTALTL